ncbi:BnaC01g27870D [Brassica napus]|uniref:BnaC01g27870D protein n=1 Tax=Brassica napus TaxID=3708 RepID=A0A078HJN0_BRANA|nr:BnaC01g27870D [Brassica napus]
MYKLKKIYIFKEHTVIQISSCGRVTVGDFLGDLKSRSQYARGTSVVCSTKALGPTKSRIFFSPRKKVFSPLCRETKHDANAKKQTSEVVKNCVDMIKEIIYDAEYIIETFIIKDELGKDGGIKKRIRRLACIIPERREIALEIESLSKRISKVICDMEKFGVQKIIADVRDPQPSQQRVEFARKYESNLVGLEENVEKLVGHLVGEEDVQVVSMTGMGGLGKTTLARQAFNHDKVKSKFDRLVWVCVTQLCDPMIVWQAIFRTLRPNEEENKILGMKKATLQDQLFQLLETFKSLIVFDDIWKEEDWKLIKPIFPHNKGSKVLLTSRNERVAGRGETYINFRPDFLSDENSWTLFQRIERWLVKLHLFVNLNFFDNL